MLRFSNVTINAHLIPTVQIQLAAIRLTTVSAAMGFRKRFMPVFVLTSLSLSTLATENEKICLPKYQPQK